MGGERERITQEVEREEHIGELERRGDTEETERGKERWSGE